METDQVFRLSYIALIVLQTCSSLPQISIGLITGKDEWLVDIARVALEAEKNRGRDFFLNIVDGKSIVNKNDFCPNLAINGSLPSLLLDADSECEHRLPRKLASSVGLPVLSIGQKTVGPQRLPWSPEGGQECGVLVRTPDNIIPFVIRDVSKHFRISTVIVLYDDSIDLSDRCTEIFTSKNTTFLMYKLNETGSDVLERLKSLRMLHYFLVGKVDTFNRILELAQSLRMFGTEYGWYLITKDTRSLVCDKCFDGSVLLFYPQEERRTTQKTMSNMVKVNQVSNLDAFYYYDLFHLCLDVIYEMIEEKSLSVVSTKECEIKVQNQSDLFACDFGAKLAQSQYVGRFGRFVFENFETTKNYQRISMKISQINLWQSQPYRAKSMGSWTFDFPQSSLRFVDNVKTEERRIKYSVVTVVTPPFVMKYSNGTFYGYLVDLLDMIRETLGNKWDYEIYECPDGEIGKIDKETRLWSGMVGEFQHKRATIGLGPVSLTSEREKAVDFTVPVYDLVGITIMMKKPTIPSHLFKFLTVLDDNVWFSILSAYFLTSFFLFVFDRISPYSYYNLRKRSIDTEERKQFDLKEALWFCMTSLTPQGGGEAPLNLSGLLTTATWWLFGFIVVTSYTANLAAFLTVSRLDTGIDSLHSLATQYQIKYAPVADSISYHYFRRRAYIEKLFHEKWLSMSLNESLSIKNRVKIDIWEYPLSDQFTKIWKQITTTGSPATFEEGTRWVLGSYSNSDGFALLEESTYVKYLALINCDVQEVGSEFSKKPIALILPKNSSLTRDFNGAILKLMNERKLEELKETWWTRNPQRKVCDDEVSSNTEGISITNIGGVFIIILVGIILACVTLAIEFFFEKRKLAKVGECATLTRNVITKKGGGPKGGQQKLVHRVSIVSMDRRGSFTQIG